jgi:hypothetical protein
VARSSVKDHFFPKSCGRCIKLMESRFNSWTQQQKEEEEEEGKVGLNYTFGKMFSVPHPLFDNDI